MEENNTTNKKGGKLWGMVGAIIVIAVVIGVFVGTRPSAQTAVPIDTTDTNPAATSTASLPPADTTSTYKDGTYSAIGDYTSPGGAESIQVTLTLQNDIVTDATVVSDATRPNSVKFQGEFIAGYKAQVIGQDISTLNLTKVSGSSLTPKGFDDAVAKIKVEATA